MAVGAGKGSLSSVLAEVVSQVATLLEGRLAALHAAFEI